MSDEIRRMRRLCDTEVAAVTTPPGSLIAARYVNVPARTLQPGDRTREGLTVLRTSPCDKALVIRFAGDNTLWRVHPDSPVQIEVR